MTSRRRPLYGLAAAFFYIMAARVIEQGQKDPEDPKISKAACLQTASVLKGDCANALRITILSFLLLHTLCSKMAMI